MIIKNRTFASSNGNPAVVWRVEKANGSAALSKVLDRAEALLIEESLKEDGDSLALEFLDEVREARSNPDLDALRELAGGLMMVWEEQPGNKQLDRLITDLYSIIDGE